MTTKEKAIYQLLLKTDEHTIQGFVIRRALRNPSRLQQLIAELKQQVIDAREELTRIVGHTAVNLIETY